MGHLGRGYGPLSMRIQRSATDMFSLSLQVAGKNVSTSSERASEKGVTHTRISLCYRGGNTAHGIVRESSVFCLKV
jgi:hypothetical protein